VLATPAKAGHVRLCTHLDISDQEIDAVVEAAARLAAHSLEP
jgi:threonine aldolase